jgi:tetratricopeptide (TPR) repeat protein
MFRRISAGSDGSAAMPIILQLEDLHWADDESLDFLKYLAEIDRAVPLLVVASTRPTLFERRPDWNRIEDLQQRIDLHPLDKGYSRDLANELLRKLPEIPAALRELITGGSEGNPFYMEELVKMLIDQGAIDTRAHDGDACGDGGDGDDGVRWQLHANRLLATRLPTTLVGVLQSRLDGLPPPEKRTLQEASVIGPVFWDRALIALDAEAEVMLPRLVQRQLTVPHADSAFDGLREYAFMHHLLHQVTYETVLKSTRRELHGKLAAWLAGQAEQNTLWAGDLFGITAAHFEDAGAAADAAEFHTRAAVHAAERFAHAAALDHVDRAFALLSQLAAQSDLPHLRWRLLDVRERTLDLQGDRERQAVDQEDMAQLAEALNDDAKRAQVAYRRSVRAMRVADWPTCEEAARRAVDAAARTSEDELRLSSQRLVGLAMARQGRWAAAGELLPQVMREARTLGLKRPQAHCLNSLTVIAGFEGKPLPALQLARQSLEVFRELGDRRSEAIALGNVGEARLVLGDLDAARPELEEALRLTRANGDRALEWGPLCYLAALAEWQGDAARALTLARVALETAAAVGAREGEAFAAIRLGHAELAFERFDAARAAFAAARDTATAIRSAAAHGATAGLALAALGRGDLNSAMREVEVLLRQHDHDASFGGAERPAAIELACYRVLDQAGDARAPEWLRRIHAKVQANAAAIDDPALVSMFLANIPEHRQIVAAFAAQRAD